MTDAFAQWMSDHRIDPFEVLLFDTVICALIALVGVLALVSAVLAFFGNGIFGRRR